ncbi:diaminopimelate epimerase [Planctomycetota bacterium]
MADIPFVKMHGTGNDFILVEKKNLGDIPSADFALDACSRHFGAGSDGLLVVEDSEEADIAMRMHNPDGSEAMCGNGIRCFAKYVYERGILNRDTMNVETIGGIKELKLTVSGDTVQSIRVNMGDPIFERKLIPVAEQNGPVPVIDQPITALDRTFNVVILSMGNPHCVIFAEELCKEDVIKYGSIIENDPFFPERINTEFVKVISRDKIQMNVFERGAGYTLSCGTGTCASAVASCLKGFTDGHVTVEIPGGILEVEYSEGGPVFMSGPAAFVYEGIYFYRG